MGRLFHLALVSGLGLRLRAAGGRTGLVDLRRSSIGIFGEPLLAEARE